jgi:hypothetical protein
LTDTTDSFQQKDAETKRCFNKTIAGRQFPTCSPVALDEIRGNKGGDNKMIPDDWNPRTDWVEFEDGSHVDPNPFHYGLPIVRTFEIRRAVAGEIRLVQAKKSEASG